jgi:hypothetical protein
LIGVKGRRRVAAGGRMGQLYMTKKAADHLWNT